MAVDEKTIQPDIMQNAPFLKELIPILLIGGGLSIVALFWTIGAHFARKRRQALEQLAEALGFTFIPKALPTVLVGIPQFTLLQAGRRKQIENLLCGSNGTTQVMIFDWRYVTGSGKSSRTHLSTIVAIQSQELRQPLWLCRPESVFDKIGLTFDGRDIDFEDQPLFSMKYHLHGNNEKRIRDLFDSDVCTFFAQHTGMYAEASGEWLIYCRQEKKIAPEKVRELLQDAFQLHVLLKAAPAESQPAISDQARDEMPPEAERQL